MSVLIYAETWNGAFKKATFETASYGVALAKKLGVEAVALTINSNNSDELANYGVSKIISINNESLKSFSAKNYAQAIKSAFEKVGASCVVMNTSSNVNSILPSLSFALDASSQSGIISLPESTSPFIVKRKVFSNKASADVELKKENKVLVISNNSFGVHEESSSPVTEELDVNIDDNRISVKSSEVASGKLSLMDADTVVSAGRGLKAPENWTMIEELADILNAATACSKPVSDIGWRPHSEHVGQTGKNIAPNLYFAIGISGAIQHVAGINSSKVIVAINTDDEAPIFKAADYGIVGDAFKVVPELIEKIKEIKG